LRVLVLDTSAFIMGFNPTGSKTAYSVRSVEDELVQGSMPYLRFRLSREKGSLVVRNPSEEARRAIEEQSAKTGEAGFVSEVDREVVALALDLKNEGLDPVVVSDDYGVQNLSEHLNLGYGSLANIGIVHRFNWIMVCTACHRRYKVPEKVCRVCGTELKRKVVSKTKALKKEQAQS
jgi:endoribonuclease Nob1